MYTPQIKKEEKDYQSSGHPFENKMFRYTNSS